MSTRRNVLLATLVILPVAMLIISRAPAGAARRSAASTTLSRPVTVQKCGQIVVLNGNLLNPPQAQQAANCFELAFQQCSAASLVFTTSSIDTSVIRTLLVSKHGGSCTITDTVKRQIAPRPPQHKQTYTCSGVIQESKQLLVTACGADGNVMIPF